MTLQLKVLITIAIMWIAFGFAVGNLCFGQSYWKRIYGGAGDDYFYAIQPTTDGNFLIAGYTQSFGAGGEDGWLLKIKPNGDTIWTKTYGGVNTEVFYAIQPTADENFLIAGRTSSFGMGGGWLLKIKPDGDTIWAKTYGRSGDEFYAIQPASDGNFLIVGYTQSYGAGGEDGWLVKINSNGDTILTKTYGGAFFDRFNTIQSTTDGNFLIAGSTQSTGVVGDYGWLVKINPNGDIIWTKTYGIATSFRTIQHTADDNLLLAGCVVYPVGDRHMDGWLTKINSNGETISATNYGQDADDHLNMIQLATDGNFLIAGSTSGMKGAGGWIIKIKPNGDTIWTKIYGKAGIGEFYVIQPTTVGNFFIIGNGAAGAGFSDGALMCLISDQYAYEDSPFIFKIPTYGEDSLNFGYTALQTPSAMTVSPGGTISWTPKTDSVYMDNVEFLVFNDIGKKDTLTFNIFVNSNYHPPISVKQSQLNKIPSKPIEIFTTSLSGSGKIKFSLPPSTRSLFIYDINGRIIDKVIPVASGIEACVVWPNTLSDRNKISTGKYFAKVSAGKNSAVKPFLFFH
jgi:hypothetical protein